MTGVPLIVPCPDCRTATRACRACRQYGWRRARLVLTVANLDTGAVASHDVVPGVLEPRPTPAGGWHLALTPLLRDLAAAVGAGSFHHVSASTGPPGERTVPLFRDWRPELPAEERHLLEAAAIAGWTRTPWQVFLGRAAARPGADPLPHHLAYVSRGHQGVRCFVRAGRPEAPSLADLIRLVLGLDLAITVTVRNYRHNDGGPFRLHGAGWDIEISAPTMPVAVPELPIHPTVETAIADCLEYLDLALAETVPADPAQAIPVPSAPESSPVEDPMPLLTQLGDRYAGQPVAVHYDRTGCHRYQRGDNHTARHLASAATLDTLTAPA